MRERGIVDKRAFGLGILPPSRRCPQGCLGTGFELLTHVPPQVRPVFLPLALVRRDLERMSRADFDPFVPQTTSRLRTLWTLWRASRTREFGG